MRINELALRSPDQVRGGLLERWAVMNDSIERGMRNDGVLPGGLNVRRRAKGLRDALVAQQQSKISRSPTEAMDWVSTYAIAVNEENAAGSRVVTAPTNGAAGIIPAVIRYYREFYQEANEEGIVAFLLTAAAIGGLCKRNASLSGAEVGCQGEVGVACSMAAAGLAAALGGSNAQIENAAEIGIEHHLGMSCDPVGGLVQIPCIERNAMGAVKAINAASLALARRRHAPRRARCGDQDDVRDRPRHDGQVQGNLARRACASTSSIADLGSLRSRPSNLGQPYRRPRCASAAAGSGPPRACAAADPCRCARSDRARRVPAPTPR